MVTGSIGSDGVEWRIVGRYDCNGVVGCRTRNKGCCGTNREEGLPLDVLRVSDTGAETLVGVFPQQTSHDGDGRCAQKARVSYFFIHY